MKLCRGKVKNTVTPADKMQLLKGLLGSLENVVLAYSGGVDSSFLLSVANEVLGDKVLVVTAKSPTFPESEYRFAEEFTRGLRSKFLSIDVDQLSQPELASNPPERCYYCKRQLFDILKKIAVENNAGWVIDGSNLDDQKDYRPGSRALKELGIRSPLIEAGFTKEEIRKCAKESGFSFWNKPSSACLASRVPYGIPISKETLDAIDRAEELLRIFGFSQVRVRHHGNTARIEIQISEIEKLIAYREKVVMGFKALGYTYIVLDLEGYRTGSLNLALFSQQNV
ncbi:MAG TPA: ATP-dependent sacrificial sulfur transferase LarE [Desulfotomaculum sp.]|nr:ATP-dependent sacrificial sulfur transferase LarE [Desulfotomaculum sp.]